MRKDDYRKNIANMLKGAYYAGYVYVITSRSPTHMIAKIGRTVYPVQRIKAHESTFTELGANLKESMAVSMIAFPDSYKPAIRAEFVLRGYKETRPYRLDPYYEWFSAPIEDAGYFGACLFLALGDCASDAMSNGNRIKRYYRFGGTIPYPPQKPAEPISEEEWQSWLEYWRNPGNDG